MILSEEHYDSQTKLETEMNAHLGHRKNGNAGALDYTN